MCLLLFLFVKYLILQAAVGQWLLCEWLFDPAWLFMQKWHFYTAFCSALQVKNVDEAPKHFVLSSHFNFCAAKLMELVS